MTGQLRIVAEIEGADAALEVATALDQLAGAVAAFEVHPEDGETAALWRVEAYPRAPLLDAALEVRLALTAAGAGGKLQHVVEERLPERDWLLENRRAFPPLRIGRFFVHGSHWRGPAPSGTFAIEIDAATAFGTGEHPSTRGCLLALDDLARRRVKRGTQRGHLRLRVELGMEVRIFDKAGSPEIPRQQFHVLHRIIPLPRVRFVMDEAGIGRVDDAITGFPRLETEHDIAEHQSEAFVVPAQLPEHVLPHHLAGAGDRQIVPVAPGRAEHA